MSTSFMVDLIAINLDEHVDYIATRSLPAIKTQVCLKIVVPLNPQDLSSFSQLKQPFQGSFGDTRPGKLSHTELERSTMLYSWVNPLFRHGFNSYFDILSGNFTQLLKITKFIVSFPIKNGGSFHSYISLTEGNQRVSPIFKHIKPSGAPPSVSLKPGGLVKRFARS